MHKNSPLSFVPVTLFVWAQLTSIQVASAQVTSVQSTLVQTFLSRSDLTYYEELHGDLLS
ncbi:MAG: hypothetical protein RI894_2248, partial [Bacteroidota bacterium]